MSRLSSEATANVSSEIPKDIIHLSSNEVSGAILCERERDINMYLILITKVVNVISRRDLPEIIRLVPANCPAEVRLVNEMRIAIQPGIPPLTAIRRKVKETGI